MFWTKCLKDEIFTIEILDVFGIEILFRESK